VLSFCIETQSTTTLIPYDHLKKIPKTKFEHECNKQYYIVCIIQLERTMQVSNIFGESSPKSIKLFNNRNDDIVISI